MVLKQIKTIPALCQLLMMATFILFFSSCGNGGSSSDESAKDTGMIAFKIDYHDDGDLLSPEAAIIDCIGNEIETVEAAVYRSGNVLLRRGGPWDCEVGQGSIDAVKAGINRTVVILGKDRSGSVIFRGEKSGITVDANIENNAGAIDCFGFVPQLIAPADGVIVNPGAMELAWTLVEGVTRYQVLISINEDLSNPIINQVSTAEYFQPQGLTTAQTYYWQVSAIDAFDNSGVGSNKWSFTFDAQHQNSPPSAQITQPEDGRIFRANDVIAFACIASDPEDGMLNGASVVWRSDVDGQIGTGTEPELPTLSSGSHQLLLTVIDSEGAIATDTVAITITENAGPVAQISEPADGSTFTTSDNIAFAGNGSDAEDGNLAGDALVWRSDIDGQIGSGEAFAFDGLSAGTHQITLTATDANGATGINTVTVTVEDLGPHGIMFLDSVDDVGMYSTIAVDAGRIFIGYYDETHGLLKVASSLNDGYDWTRSAIEYGNGVGRGSSIAVDGENVFISTTINIPTFSERVGIVTSYDNGATWQTSEIVTDHATNGDYDEFATSIALDGQSVYISYLTSSTLTLRLLKSTYSVTDWEGVNISPPPDDFENGYYSSMNLYNGMLYISHSGYTVSDVYLTKITTALSDPVSTLVDQVGIGGDKGYTTSVVTQVGGRTHVYVAYFDESAGNLDLKFGRSVNDGGTFSLWSIDNSSDVVGKYPSMAVSGDVIYVAYYDETNGNLKIAISSDYGDTWETTTVDPATDNVGRFASLAVDGQKVYISYYDETNKDLKFAKSIDGGNSWQ